MITIIIFQISNIYFQSFKLLCHHEWRRGSSSFLLYKFAQKCLFFRLLQYTKWNVNHTAWFFVYVMKRAVYNISHGWNERQREVEREHKNYSKEKSREQAWWSQDMSKNPHIFLLSCHVPFGYKKFVLIISFTAFNAVLSVYKIKYSPPLQFFLLFLASVPAKLKGMNEWENCTHTIYFSYYNI